MTPTLSTENLAVAVGGKSVLSPVNMSVNKGEIVSVIGPANSGKTTLLRALNRLLDLEPAFRVSGDVRLEGQSVYGRGADLPRIRRQIGTVFSTPVVLPKSILKNLVLGLKLQGIGSARAQRQAAEEALNAANLWDEVKDRLDDSALKLSGGQQQRLCLARTLALQPKVLLLDEPSSGLDPISTAKIENTLQTLKNLMGILLVTNNVKQASRVSDRTLFLYLGELVESAPTDELFTNPKDPRTADYIMGRFG